MKFVIVIILSVVLATSCNINSGSDITNGSQNIINSYYTVKDEKEDLASVFFLGYDENYIENGKIVDRSFLESVLNKHNISLKDEELELIDGIGDEWYLILPKYKDESISIWNVELDGNGELVKTGEEYTTNKAVLLKCNISDIIPSVLVKISANDKTVEFSPFISLKDGKISDIDFVYTE